MSMDEQRSSLLSCFKCTLMTGCNALTYPPHHYHVPEGYCINITLITTFILANNAKCISFLAWSEECVNVKFVLASQTRLHKLQSKRCRIKCSTHDSIKTTWNFSSSFFLFLIPSSSPTTTHMHTHTGISLDLMCISYLAVDAHSSSVVPAEGV